VSWALFMFYRVPVAIDIEGGYVRRCGRPWGRVVGAAIGDTGSVKQVLRSAEGRRRAGGASGRAIVARCRGDGDAVD